MNGQIFFTDCNFQYTLGENYPTDTKFFIAERLQYQDCWKINLAFDYDSIEDLCTDGDGDWGYYCQQQYDAEWLEQYLSEWGTLPLRIVECNANGFIKNYTLENYAPTGTIKYTATQYVDDKPLVEACDKAGLINILY